MRKKLNEWADASKVLHGLVLIGFAIAFMVSILSCEDDFHIGKSEEEIKTELYQTMFEVDSILLRIKYQLDTTDIDGTFYLNAQRINNGSN
tara:strand:+ start:486 stop:758 length:273 start_codon:yes stop_codon:yes gene_type:complete